MRHVDRATPRGAKLLSHEGRAGDSTNAVTPSPRDYHSRVMGLEAECTVRVGRKASVGKALLEGETLVFRGDFRLDIPFDRMKDVAVDGGALVVRTDENEARLELGAPMADRWARLIKEPKGLFEKLEIGPQSRVAVVDVRDALFLTALRERAASVVEGRVPGGSPIIFFGAETRDALRKIHLLRARLVDTGVLWIVRPKGSKAISEADVFEALRDRRARRHESRRVLEDTHRAQGDDSRRAARPGGAPARPSSRCRRRRRERSRSRR